LLFNSKYLKKTKKINHPPPYFSVDDMKLEDDIQQETDIFQKAIGLAKENQRLAREREQAEEELKQATRQKELILNSAGEGIYGLDLEGNTTFANPAAEKLLGYTEEELLGKPQHAIIHHSKPDGSPYPREDCHIYAAIKDGKVHRESEEVFWRKDGTCFPVEYASTPIWENENLVGAVVTFQDITKRKKAEEKLQAQAKQQEGVTQLGNIALTGTDLSELMDQTVHLLSRILKVEYTKILKLIPEEQAFLMLAGCGWKEGLVGKAKVPDEIESQAGYTLRSNCPVVVKDLNRETRFSGPQLLLDHEVISGMSVIIHSGKRAFGVLGIHTKQMRIFTSDEINFLQSIANVLAVAIERKKAERALRDSKIRANAVLNHALEGIITIDEQGIIHSFNPSAERLFGYKASEIMGTNIKFLMPEPFQSEHDQYLKNYLTTGVSKIIGVGREVVGLRKDGSTFPLDLGISEMYLDETRMFTGIVRDITERKKAEAQNLLQYELTKIFLDGQSLEKTFPRILQAVGEFMKWEIGFYWEKNPESKELHCRYAWNADGLNENGAFKEFKAISFKRAFNKGTGLPGRVWDDLKPFWIPDVRTNKNFPLAPFAENVGMKAGFGFPVFSNNQFVGMIEFFTRQLCAPDNHHIQFMTNLGSQIGQWMRLKKADEQLEKLNLKNLD
jgi:PAS domain S-box-containing protein